MKVDSARTEASGRTSRARPRCGCSGTPQDGCVQRHTRGALGAQRHGLNRAHVQPEPRPLTSRGRRKHSRYPRNSPRGPSPSVASNSRRGGRLLPSKAGARAEAWGLGARRLTVRSLSVPPLWFRRQVYTVEPGTGGRSRVREPLGPAAPQHSSAHARLRNRVMGCPRKARPRSEAATTQRPREGRAGHPAPPSPEEGGS